MTFRTDVRISKSPLPVTLKTPIFTAGSCFADAIGSRLAKNKFQVLNNPFGVVYNPISINRLILKAIANEPLAEHTFVERDGIHANFEFHSSYSSQNRQDLNVRLMNVIGATHYFLQKAKWIFITYGTSWIYQLKDTGEVVANCHKIPAAHFEKRLLTETEIINSFQTMLEGITRFNPDAKIILTLSPVRHLRDTIELNSVSKARLRSAIHTITTLFKGTDYFPAYEIIMDDLRDYRFYKADMIHPTTQAEDYIWEKFEERYFDPQTRDFVESWNSLSASLNHRAFHPAASGHQEFLRQTLDKLHSLRTTIDVEAEISSIQSQLK